MGWPKNVDSDHSLCIKASLHPTKDTSVVVNAQVYLNVDYS